MILIPKIWCIHFLNVTTLVALIRETIPQISLQRILKQIFLHNWSSREVSRNIFSINMIQCDIFTRSCARLFFENSHKNVYFNIGLSVWQRAYITTNLSEERTHIPFKGFLSYTLYAIGHVHSLFPRYCALARINNV